MPAAVRTSSSMCRSGNSSPIRSASATRCSPPGRWTSRVCSADKRRKHMNISFVLNGKPTSVDVEPSMLLCDLLREKLSLTGTHVGCDTSQCGACVVHVGDSSVKSCTLLAVAVDGASVTPVDGLGKPEALHPMQLAFHENHGLQCGFCTPGMLMSSVEFAKRHPNPTEADVRHWLEGNLCRCTGYQNIINSVLRGTAAMHAEQGA